MNKVRLLGNVVKLKGKDDKGKETNLFLQERKNSDGTKFYSINFKVITDKNSNYGGQWILCSMTSKENEFPFETNVDYYLEGHIRSWSKDNKVGQSIQIDDYREITVEERKENELQQEVSYSTGSSGL